MGAKLNLVAEGIEREPGINDDCRTGRIVCYRNLQSLNHAKPMAKAVVASVLFKVVILFRREIIGQEQLDRKSVG